LTALYAMVLATGVIGLVAWVIAASLAASVDGRSDLDPEIRFGSTGRMMIAAAVGFGMGGMSATFAGWDLVPSLLGAAAGGLLAAAIARYLGPTAEDAE